MNCQYCQNSIPEGATSCPSCGAAVQQQPQAPVQPQQQPQQQLNTKSVFIAQLLSCVLCGLGQMYNGQVVKGLVCFLVCIVVGVFTGGIGGGIIWFLTVIDARKIAQKINAGRAVGPWEFF